MKITPFELYVSRQRLARLKAPYHFALQTEVSADARAWHCDSPDTKNIKWHILSEAPNGRESKCHIR